MQRRDLRVTPGSGSDTSSYPLIAALAVREAAEISQISLVLRLRGISRLKFRRIRPRVII